MKYPLITALCIPLALSGCATPASPKAPAHAQVADVQGHWVGTYFQDNEHRGYPMELTAHGDPSEFGVTLDWPELWQSRTVGHGSIHAGTVVWTEDRLVRGKNIALDGRYEAALIDSDTLVGVYEKDHRRMGFFTLSRTHGEGKVTEIAPISMKVKLSG
jgi:hypothetical protein